MRKDIVYKVMTQGTMKSMPYVASYIAEFYQKFDTGNLTVYRMENLL